MDTSRQTEVRYGPSWAWYFACVIVLVLLSVA
jgi:hypothetical protein